MADVKIGVEIDVQKIEGIGKLEQQIKDIVEMAEKIPENAGAVNMGKGGGSSQMGTEALRELKETVKVFKQVLQQLTDTGLEKVGKKIGEHMLNAIEEGAKEIENRIKNAFESGGVSIRDDLSKASAASGSSGSTDSTSGKSKGSNVKIKDVSPEKFAELANKARTARNVIDVTNDEFAELSNQSRESVDALDEASREFLKIADNVLDTGRSVDKASDEIADLSDQTTETTDKLDEAANEFLEIADNVLQTGRAVDKASGDLSGIKGDLEKVSQSGQEFVTVSDKMGKSFQKSFQKMLNGSGAAKKAAKNVSGIEGKLEKVSESGVEFIQVSDKMASKFDKNFNQMLDSSRDFDKIEKQMEQASKQARETSQDVNKAVSGTSTTSGGSDGAGVEGLKNIEEITEEAKGATKEFASKSEGILETFRNAFNENINRIDLSALNRLRRQLRSLAADTRLAVGSIEQEMNDAEKAFEQGKIGKSMFESIQREAQEAQRKFSSNLDKMEADLAEIDEHMQAAQVLPDLDENLNHIRKEADRLEATQKDLANTSATSTSELKNQGNIARRVNKDYDNLIDELNKVEKELRSIQAQTNDSDLSEAIDERLDQLDERRRRLRDSVGGVNERQQRQQLVQFERGIKSASNAVPQFRQTLAKLKNGLSQAGQQLEKGGEQSGQAARDIKRFGKNAQDARTKVQNNIQVLERLRRKTGGLSDSNRQLLSDLKRLETEFGNISSEVKSTEDRLDRVEKRAKSAGQGFAAYNRDLQDSIVNNFKFINAIGLVTAAIFGLQQAFHEVLRESEAMARAMTVLRSQTKSLGVVANQVRKDVRATAQAFGVRIDEVSEAMFQLGSAGLSAETSMAGLDQIMKLLISTQGSAQETTKAVAGLYNVFGDQLSETGNQMLAFKRITDVLSTTYRDHQVELSEMTEGLKFVAATGKAAGFSFEQLSAQLAVLNDNLIKSGQAGRVLQRVISQFASKSDQFTKVLGIEVDDSQPLPDQFMKALESAREQMREGLSVEELRQQFELFGLRGAKGFVTLAQNAEDVRDVLEDMKDESSGVTDQLVQIQKKSLFRQFERAKQALIALVNEGMEPVIQLLKLFANIMIEIKEVLNETGLDHFVAIIGILGSTALILFQSMKAVINVLWTFGTRVKESVISLFSFNQLLGQNIAKLGAAGNSVRFYANNLQEFTAKTNGAILANNNFKSSVGSTSAIVNALGGKLNIFLAILTSVITAYAAWQTMFSSTSQSISKTSSEIAKLNKQMDDNEKFIENIEDLQEEFENSAITAERAGRKIRNAFVESGSIVSSKIDLIGKSNEELANGIDQITASLKEYNKAVEKRLQQDKLEKISKNIEDIGDSFRQNVIDDSSFFGDQQLNKFVAVTGLTEQLRKEIDKTGTVSENTAKSMGRVLNKVPGLGQDETTLFKPDPSELGAAYKRNIDNILNRAEEFRKQFGGISSESLQKFVDNIPEARKKAFVEISKMEDVAARAKLKEKWSEELSSQIQGALEIMTGVTGKFIEEASDNITEKINDLLISQTLEALNVPSDTLFDPNKGIFGIFLKLQEIAGEPLPTTTFDSAIREMKNIREETQATIDRFDEFKEQVDLDKSGTERFNRQFAEFAQFNLDENPIDKQSVVDTVTEATKNIAKKASDSKAVERARQQILENYKGILSPDLTKQDLQSGEDIQRATREIVKQLVEGTEVDTASEMANVLEVFENLGTFTDDWKKNAKDLLEVLGDKEATQELSKREGLIKDLVKEYERAVEANTTLNSVAQKRNEIERLNQRLIARQVSNISSEEIFETIEKQVDILTTGIDSTSKATEDMGQNLDSAKTAMEQLTSVGESGKALMAKFKSLMENAKLSAELERKIKEYVLNQVKLSNELEKQRTLSRQIERNYDGIVSNSVKSADMAIVTASHEKSKLESADQLTDVYEDNKEGLAAIEEQYQSIIEAQHDLRESVREEQEMMFETLATAEEALAVGEDRSAVRGKILGALDKTQYLTSRIAHFQNMTASSAKEREKIDSTILRLQSKLVDAASEGLETIEDTKEEEEEVNDLIDKRLGTLQSIKEVRDQQTSDLVDQTKSLLSQKFEKSPIKTAFEVAESTGRDVNSILANTDATVESFSESLKQGAINASNLSGRLGAFASVANASGQRLQRTNDQLERLGKRKIDLGFERANEAIKEGNIQEAQKALDRVESTAKNIFDTADERPELISHLRQILEKRRQLSDMPQGITEKLNIKFGKIIGLDRFENTWKAAVKRVKKSIKKEGGIFDVKNEAKKLEEALARVKEGTEGKGALTLFRDLDTQKVIQRQTTALETAAESLERLSREFSKTQTQARGAGKSIVNSAKSSANSITQKKQGGSIPGYGGGDIVPAMLEPGEYVIPKESVSKFGADFFESLRNGNLPGFASGGMVGVPSTKDMVKNTDLTEYEVEVLKSVAEAENFPDSNPFAGVSQRILNTSGTQEVGTAFGLVQFTQHASLDEILKKFKNTDASKFNSALGGESNADAILKAAKKSDRDGLVKAEDIQFDEMNKPKDLPLEDDRIDAKLANLGNITSFKYDQFEEAWDLYGTDNPTVVDYLSRYDLINKKNAAMFISGAINRGPGSMKETMGLNYVQNLVERDGFVNNIAALLRKGTAAARKAANDYYQRELFEYALNDYNVSPKTPPRFQHIQSRSNIMGINDRYSDAPDKNQLIDIPILGDAIKKNLKNRGSKREIPSVLQKGEFVIPSNIVEDFGADFFEALIAANSESAIMKLLMSRKGKDTGLKRFHSGGPVGFQSGGGVPKKHAIASGSDAAVQVGTSAQDTAKKIAETNEQIAKNTEETKDGVKNTEETKDGVKDFSELKSQEEIVAVKRRAQKLINELSPGLSTDKKRNLGGTVLSAAPDFVKTIGTSIDKGLEQTGPTFDAFFSDVFIPKFAKANAEAFGQFTDEISRISSQFEDTVDKSATQLQRNQSGYFQFLNSVQDAQDQRIKQQLEAERKYREQLKKTEEIITGQLSKAIDNLLSPKTVKNVFSELSDQLFGSLENNMKEFAFQFGKLVSRGGQGSSEQGKVGKFLSGAGNVVSKIPFFGGVARNIFSGLGGSKEDVMISKLENVVKATDVTIPNELEKLPPKIADSLTGQGETLNNILQEQKKEKQQRKESQDKQLGFLDKVIGGKVGEFLGRLQKVFGKAGSVLQSLFGKAFSFASSYITKSISKIINLAFSTERADSFVAFLDKFGENADKKVDNFLNNFEKIITAIGENIPVIVEKMTKRLPDIITTIFENIADVLPKLVSSIAKALPKLVDQLVPIIIDFFILLIEQAPKIIVGVIKSIGNAVEQIITNLPKIIGAIVKAIGQIVIEVVMLIPKLIGNVLSGIGKAIGNLFGGSFESGGVIGQAGGKSDAIPIIAHEGEGVLTKEAVDALGGAKAVKSLNEELPKFETGGIVGKTAGVTSSVGVKPAREATINSETNFNVNVEGGSTGNPEDDERLAEDIADKLDEKISKRIRDRDSKIADELRD